MSGRRNHPGHTPTDRIHPDRTHPDRSRADRHHADRTRPDRHHADPEHLLAAALSLAAEGLPVLPCVPGAKRPLTRHGLLDATTDARTIRAWWRQRPDANVAAVTGIAAFDVLDVDVRATGSGYPSFDLLLRADLLEGCAQIVSTPSGGLHAYFTGTDQASARLPGHHLDLKATGGYVLVPPSVVGGRVYAPIRRPVPPSAPLNWRAVRSLLDPDPTQPPRPLRRQPNGPLSTQLPIGALAAWGARRPEGQRNTATFWAACRAAEEGHVDLRPIVDAAVAAGLPRWEAVRTVNSAVRTVNSAVRTVDSAVRTVAGA